MHSFSQAATLHQVCHFRVGALRPFVGFQVQGMFLRVASSPSNSEQAQLQIPGTLQPAWQLFMSRGPCSAARCVPLTPLEACVTWASGRSHTYPVMSCRDNVGATAGSLRFCWASQPQRHRVHGSSSLTGAVEPLPWTERCQCCEAPKPLKRTAHVDGSSVTQSG